MNLENAIALAARAHEGQTDKNGQPYILHPLRVMMRLTGERQRIAAVLHDVVEDTFVRLSDIEMQFGVEIADAVDALTRREGESYSDFIERCGANDIARPVKWADLRDNLDPVRLGEVPEEVRLRLIAKYRPALDRINALAAGTRSAETSVTSAPSEGCQSGGEAVTPNG